MIQTSRRISQSHSESHAASGELADEVASESIAADNCGGIGFVEPRHEPGIMAWHIGIAEVEEALKKENLDVLSRMLL